MSIICEKNTIACLILLYLVLLFEGGFVVTSVDYAIRWYVDDKPTRLALRFVTVVEVEAVRAFGEAVDVLASSRVFVTKCWCWSAFKKCCHRVISVPVWLKSFVPLGKVGIAFKASLKPRYVKVRVIVRDTCCRM